MFSFSSIFCTHVTSTGFKWSSAPNSYYSSYCSHSSHSLGLYSPSFDRKPADSSVLDSIAAAEDGDDEKSDHCLDGQRNYESLVLLDIALGQKMNKYLFSAHRNFDNANSSPGWYFRFVLTRARFYFGSVLFRILSIPFLKNEETH